MSSHVFQHAPEVVWRALAGEAVVVAPRQATTFVLNSTGAFVWERCDGRTPVEHIIAELAQAKGALEPTVKSDTEAFCTLLQDKGLLRVVAPVHVPAPLAKRFRAPYLPPRIDLEELADKPNQRPGKRDIGGSRP